MNKRNCPCPKCLPFVGKVFIDDVWSGGDKSGISPVTGLKYPLLSDAIAQGLYHPRCKDVHSTYFEGISTPPEGSQYTADELDEMAQKYEAQQKQGYCERQEKRYERISKYSLDEDNQRMYGARAKEWSNKAEDFKKAVESFEKSDKKAVETVEKSGGSGIMESELGKFKNKLLADDRISKEYYSAIKDKFSHGSDVAKKAFNKYVPPDSVAESTFLGTPHYNPKNNKISMDYASDLINKRGAGATWFHEHGHMIDDLAGSLSKNEEFRQLLHSDYMDYMKSYGKSKGLKTFDKVQKQISLDLNDMRKHSAVSDILQGISQGNIQGVAGHDMDYWRNPDNLPSEACAHMFEAQFDKTRYNEMKKYFPNSLLKFEEILKGAVGA